MTFPLAQFVDGPSSTAVLRYDFTLKTASLQTLVLGGDGLDLGNPGWSGEPGGVGGVYGYRSLRLTQRIIGSKTDALARMNTLSKEMLRAGNWLRVQLDATRSPVYFKTYRTEPGTLSLEWIETAGAWDITVPLVADPFAYGPRVTLAPVTLGHSLSATNSMRYVLPAIKGDAPTPIRVAANLSGMGAAATPATWLNCAVAVDSGTVADTVIDIGTGDVFTASSGTAAPAVDAAMLGGSSRTTTITSPSTLVQRLGGVLASAPPQGRYKVMLKVVAAPASTTVRNTYQFRVGQSINALNDKAQADIVTVTTPEIMTATNAQPYNGWVDLGELTFPYNVGDIPESATATPPAPLLLLDIGVSGGGAGSVVLDAFKLIPVSGPAVRQSTTLKTTLVYGLLSGAGIILGGLKLVSTDTITWDDTDQMWAVDTATSVITPGVISHAGGYPVVHPGAAQNVLICLPTSAPPNNGTTTAMAVGSTWSLTLSYYPRYLHVGDGT